MGLMEKPQAMEKFYKFYKAIKKDNWKVGNKLRILELVYSNACNFKCEHCSTRAPFGENAEKLMPLEKVSALADEAHELGVYEWSMHGGELLTNKARLLELIAAIKPERFYVFLTSNGYLLSEDVAYELAEAGINRVSVSLDSFVPAVHDSFRGVKGAHERAINALKYVKKAGMDAYMNITVGHFNALSQDVEDLCKYSYDNGYQTFINIAVPTGNWQGNLDVVIDEKDREHLEKLRQKYGNITRDVWNPFDRSNSGFLGCQAMSRIYVTPSGDVFPCSFMHINVGNVYEKTLKEIVDYGCTIKYFTERGPLCLVGEDLDFINKYMVKEKFSVMHPLEARSIFSSDDYISED